MMFTSYSHIFGRHWVIEADRDGISAIRLTNRDDSATQHPSELTRLAVEQLAAYASGDLQVFDLPLNPVGTPFQKQVWKALSAIPYGQTISYKTLAINIGNPKAMRAVGNANGKNPIPIIIPCHRVIASSGKLHGYSLGLDLKQRLLAHEGVCSALLF